MIELPESAFSALGTSPDAFVQEMCLAAAIKWYEVGTISQSKSRQEFLDAMQALQPVTLSGNTSRTS